jgi:hypothetical protein
MSDLPDAPAVAKDPGLILARSALFAGLCLLVPVPFLDEILAQRARRHMVSSLLAWHGSATSPSELKLLWAGPSAGCLRGALGLLGKLLIWPIKKLLRTVFFFLAARVAAMEVSRCYLLGRTVDRLLRAGRFAGPQVQQEATAAARAFETAFRHLDRRFVAMAGSQLIAALKGVGAGTIRAVRDLMKRVPESQTQPEIAALPAEEQAEVRSLLERFQAILTRPEVQEFVEDFDRRFDTALRDTSASAATLSSSSHTGRV